MTLTPGVTWGVLLLLFTGVLFTLWIIYEERGPTMAGKYDSPRDEVLHLLCTWEWANESDGNVEAPTGYFWRIGITEAELPEITDVLRSCTDERPILDTLLDPALLRSLIGSYLVTEDTEGFVHVLDCRTDEPARSGDDRARVAFQAKRRAFLRWEAGLA